jgi:translation initiation factor 5B
MIRQPIIVVLGHVDHGKTSLLDKIRNTTIANKESGGITQHIGASEVPISVIEKLSGPLLKKFGNKITIPGLLFIDTPGHEAFTNLRKRGGSLADLAILVVDITKNLEPQTYEALEILKEYKTPFVVAANKIDLITGWINSGNSSFTDAISKQQPSAVERLDSLLYTLVGKLSEVGFNSERFDRVSDFTKEILVLPVSAKTGEGISELLVYVTGIAQRFLDAQLNIDVNGPGKGSILERKEEKGLGSTIDIILYNGTLKINDTVAFATENGVATSKIKALLKPKFMQETKESKSKFYYVDFINAASGVKISGTGFENALAGSLIMSTEIPDYMNQINTELSEVFAVDSKGIILKADTIGTIEALSRLLKDAGAEISKKGLGNVTKRDILDAYAMKATDPNSAVILAFNVNIEEDADNESQITGINVIKGDIIYKLIDDYKAWCDGEKKREKEAAEKSIIFPCAIQVLPNHCFRISHPAIFGVDIIGGRIKPGIQLINQEGAVVGKLRELQDNGTQLQEAKKGDSVAISVEDAVFGRQIKDNYILYSNINDSDYLLLKTKFKHLLNEDDLLLLEKIEKIKKDQK